MCGIAGYIGNYTPDVARAMMKAQAHRGPDGHGSFIDLDAAVALTHCRLSIIDLSNGGHQPMTDASGNFTIVFNGEIYNYRELRDELVGRGVVFKGSSDTEVILALYALDGPAIFRRLNGIFALAIWDARDHSLTLARDGLGVKPLYLHESARGIAFASELKALLALPDLDKTIDPVAATAYLTYLWSPGERTMFSSVRKMAPGTWRRINRDRTETTGVFYTLPAYTPDRTRSLDDLVIGTADHVRQAVDRQMVADVEVGAFLSGGLDSSAIVAFAKDHDPGRRLKCFTIDYDATSDEAAELVPDIDYARQAAAYLGVDLHCVNLDSTIAADFERLVYTLDEPQADPAALNSLYISAIARESGIKVMLSGTGGDDIFSGYRRHGAARLDPMIAAVPRGVRQAAASAAGLLPVGNTTARRIRKMVSGAARDTDARLAGYFEWLSADEAGDLLAIGDDTTAAMARQPMLDVLARNRGVNAVERMLRLEQTFFLADHNLSYTDKTGMAEGVEIRVPLLDIDLVAFAATIPTRYKIRRGVTKWIFRKAMEPYLPHGVIYRPKTGFGVPLRAWLRGPLRSMLEELTDPKVIEQRAIFDAAAVQKLKAATLDGRVDGSYSLLSVMTIELWSRRFVDARPSQAA